MSSASEIPVWMQQPHETRKAYHAFSLYRDLGTNRSLDKAYAVAWLEKHLKTDKTAPTGPIPKGPRHWDKWSAAHRWVERAAAFDTYINQQAQEAFENELIARRQQTLRDEYDAAIGQFALWRKEYEAAIASGFDLKSLNLLARISSTLNAQRRLALGMPTSAADLTSGGEKLPGNVVISVDDLADVFKQIRQHKKDAQDAGS